MVYGRSIKLEKLWIISAFIMYDGHFTAADEHIMYTVGALSGQK